MAESKGVLYGIGVGPGDPELLTVKAVRAIENGRCGDQPHREDGQTEYRLSHRKALYC